MPVTKVGVAAPEHHAAVEDRKKISRWMKPKLLRAMLPHRFTIKLALNLLRINPTRIWIPLLALQIRLKCRDEIRVIHLKN